MQWEVSNWENSKLCTCSEGVQGPGWSAGSGGGGGTTEFREGKSPFSHDYVRKTLAKDPKVTNCTFWFISTSLAEFFINPCKCTLTTFVPIVFDKFIYDIEKHKNLQRK